jgi:PhoPQ-activated pathogenicity-related protein
MAHFQAMDGAYSFALEPYYNENLTQYLTSPLSSLLFDLEDIYSESLFCSIQSNFNWRIV